MRHHPFSGQEPVKTSASSIKAARFTEGGPRKTEITHFSGPQPSHVSRTVNPERLIQCVFDHKGHGL